ncbi:MAG: hypothetical protein JWO36_7375 [Myxococcales bacterium]|nr:hypothetical protein [Myxococcales bacterium]
MVVLWLASACAGHPDAGSTDASGGADASTHAWTVCNATKAHEIRFVLNGQAIAGAQVVFHDQDGTVQEATTTDSAGYACADSPRVLVTVLQPANVGTTAERVLISRILVPELSMTIEGIANYSISGAPMYMFNFASSVGGASSYRLDVGGGPSLYTTTFGSYSLTVPSQILDADGTLPVVAWAEDSGDHPLAYTVTTINFRAQNTASPITLPAWKTDLAAISVTAQAQAGETGVFSPTLIVRGHAFSTPETGTPWSGSTTTASYKIPQSGFDTYAFTLSRALGSLSGGYVEVGSSAPAAATLRASDGIALPGPVSLSGADPRPTATWTMLASSQPAVAARLEVTWRPATTRYNWRIESYGGFSSTSLTLPEIPSATFGIEPVTTPTAKLRFVTITDTSGNADLSPSTSQKVLNLGFFDRANWRSVISLDKPGGSVLGAYRN